MGTLTNQSAVVTGAGAGIGRAISLKLAEEGAKVYVTDIDIKAAQETADLIAQKGQTAVALKLDVLSEADIDAVVKRVVADCKTLDIWVNNAGVSSMGNVWEMTERDWDFNMDINAKGVFMCTKGFLKTMIAQGYGRIVNTASIASLRADPMLSCYCASKWAVAGFTRTVAKECGKFGVTANYVCPGPTETAMNERENQWTTKIVGGTAEQAKQNLIDMVPLGRLANPQDIANAVAFLASPASSYINGAQLSVTGGMDA